MSTLDRLAIWWHRKRGHHAYARRASFTTASFSIVTCDCGRHWIRRAGE